MSWGMIYRLPWADRHAGQVEAAAHAVAAPLPEAILEVKARADLTGRVIPCYFGVPLSLARRLEPNELRLANRLSLAPFPGDSPLGAKFPFPPRIGTGALTPVVTRLRDRRDRRNRTARIPRNQLVAQAPRFLAWAPSPCKPPSPGSDPGSAGRTSPADSPFDPRPVRTSAGPASPGSTHDVPSSAARSCGYGSASDSGPPRPRRASRGELRHVGPDFREGDGHFRHVDLLDRGEIHAQRLEEPLGVGAEVVLLV